MPKIATPVSRGQGLALRTLLLGLCLVAGSSSAVLAASARSSCEQQEQRSNAAWTLYGRQMWEEAAELAGRVELNRSCTLHYVRAQQLLGRIFGLKLQRIDESIAAYQRGLKVDGQQSQMWYELGFQLYQRSDYARAVNALESALVHVQTTPPDDTEGFVMQCRLLLADAADRLATLSRGRRPEHVKTAIAGWHDYQDFCSEYQRCDPKLLRLAEERLNALKHRISS